MYPVGSWLRFLNFLRRGDSHSSATAAPLISPAIRGNVIFLGLTSLLTDVSSEMVISVLPIYLITILRLSPAQFGLIDGLYQGVAALVQLASGILTDRWRKYKEVAGAGYALSAVCRIGLLTSGTASGKAAVLVPDRLGKGVRTAPRDALDLPQCAARTVGARIWSPPSDGRDGRDARTDRRLCLSYAATWRV